MQSPGEDIEQAAMEYVAKQLESWNNHVNSVPAQELEGIDPRMTVLSSCVICAVVALSQQMGGLSLRQIDGALNHAYQLMEADADNPENTTVEEVPPAASIN